MFMVSCIGWEHTYPNVNPSEMEETAVDFIRVAWEKLQMSCRDKAYIINMDQTPVPFSYDPKKPLKWLVEGQFISGSQHAI